MEIRLWGVVSTYASELSVAQAAADRTILQGGRCPGSVRATWGTAAPASTSTRSRGYGGWLFARVFKQSLRIQEEESSLKTDLWRQIAL